MLIHEADNPARSIMTVYIESNWYHILGPSTKIFNQALNIISIDKRHNYITI